MRRVVTIQIWKAVGPILLSALAIFIDYLLLQVLANKLEIGLNLLSSRGLGKIIFTSLVFYQMLLLLSTYPYSFMQKLKKTILFFSEPRWFLSYLLFLLIFCLLHFSFLEGLILTGYAHYAKVTITNTVFLNILWGFIVVFLLAWTEEAIFRGFIYQQINQYCNPIPAILLTSLIFMLSHDFAMPTNLLTKNWQLGVGLFSFGILLNTIYVATNKLYCSMGAHAGIVFMKVILRKARFIIISTTNLPFWLNVDLRQSILVHLLFLFVASIVILTNKQKFSEKKSPPKS